MRRLQGDHRVRGFAVIALLASLGAGCGADDETAGPATPESVPAVEPSPATLRGRWIRVVDEGCRSAYPLAIEFRETDYLAELDPATAPEIDSGGYELIDADTVRLTRPNDAQVDIALSLGEEQLTLTDGDGCSVSYRRA